jgi:biotin carboxylase
VAEALRYSDHLLVEEFVAGAEYSVEGILLDTVPQVLAITRKTVTAPPYFVELGHQQPSGLPEPIAATVRATVVAAVQAVGLQRSLFHVEVWVDESGAVTCGEVHGRLGGDWIHAITAYRYPGLELFGLVLDDVLGRPAHLPELDPDRAAAVVVVAGQPGTITEINSAPQIAGSTLLATDWAITVGDSISELHDSFARAGLLVFGAPNVATLDTSLSQIASQNLIRTQG